jgi:hypothetical protein
LLPDSFEPESLLPLSESPLSDFEDSPLEFPTEAAEPDFLA